MHFRSVKDLIALPLHWIAGRPAWITRPNLGAFGALARAAYFVPGSHVRRTVSNYCQATGRSDPWTIYSNMVRNLQQAGLHFSGLNRRGRSQLVTDTIIDASLQSEYERCGGGDQGLIFLVPHCAGAVLSSAGLNSFCQTVLLIREPRSPARQELMMHYLKKLGPEVIPTRHAAAATVVRQMMRSLRDHKVLVGTTDVITPAPDTVETRAFGQRIYSPLWPARIAARLDIPIVPGFIHMEGRQLRMVGGEGYREADLQISTQRWVSNFELWFRQYPSDWVFMLDKRWARVLAAAAQAAKRPTESIEYGRGPIKSGA